MLTTLIASGRKPRPSKGGVAMSLLLHGALIAGAIIGTAGVVRAPVEKVEEHPLLYVATPPPPAPLPPPPAIKAPPPAKVHVAPKSRPAVPQLAQAPRPVPPRPQPAAPVLTPPSVVPSTLPAVNPNATPTVSDVVATAPAPPAGPPASASGSTEKAGPPGNASGSGSESQSDGSAFVEDMVDRAVKALPGAPSPKYPPSLEQAGIEGQVAMRFVVDASGRVESGSIEVISSPRPEFAEAVRRAILATRYRPAEAGGRKVRQLVEQMFAFRRP
jgi:protein TonB